jgi:hypothetical protein
MQQLFKVLCEIEDLASYTPSSVGESEQWAAIVSSAEDYPESYCNALRGKTLFTALYGTYTVTLLELKNVLKASSQEDKQIRRTASRKSEAENDTPRERHPALPRKPP